MPSSFITPAYCAEGQPWIHLVSILSQKELAMKSNVHGELQPVGGGDTIPLIRDVLTIGQRYSCDIRMPFPSISGIHAQLMFRKGYWYIRDLNSTNGVKVNGTRVQEKLLHPGDEVSIGKHRYVIEYTLPSNQSVLDEDLEEDILRQSLLERAGLEKPRDKERKRNSKQFDPAEFLLDDDD
jgi:adenylate cyclase